MVAHRVLHKLTGLHTLLQGCSSSDAKQATHQPSALHTYVDWLSVHGQCLKRAEHSQGSVPPPALAAAQTRPDLPRSTMHVLLIDSVVPVPVTEACIERSAVLQQAHAAEPGPDATLRLPCGQAVWDDWASRTSDRAAPLAVARVRSSLQVAMRAQARHTPACRLQAVCDSKQAVHAHLLYRLAGWPGSRDRRVLLTAMQCSCAPHIQPLGLQLAHLLDPDVDLWAQAFWAADGAALTATALQHFGAHGESSELCGTGHSPPRTCRRAAQAKAANAAWAALLAEGRELVDAVLCMHPAVTAACAGKEGPLSGAQASDAMSELLLGLPPPLHSPALRRVLGMRNSCGLLQFQIGAADSMHIANALRGVPEVTRVHLTFGARISLLAVEPGLEAVIAMMRNVSPLLRALHSLPQLRSVWLSALRCPGVSIAPLSSAQLDLSPLSALTQLDDLRLCGGLGHHPSAAVVTRLTTLSRLELSGYVWPLGPGPAQDSNKAPDSAGGGEGRGRSAPADMWTCSGADCVFPRLRKLTFRLAEELPNPRLPVAPSLEHLSVLRCPTAIVRERFMDQICSCAAAARSALTRLGIGTSFAGCHGLRALLTQLPRLRSLQLVVALVSDAAAHAAVMSALGGATSLDVLQIALTVGDTHEMGVGEQMLCARAVRDSLAALTGLRTLDLQVAWDAPAAVQRLVSAATSTRLSALSDLHLEAGRFRYQALSGMPVALEVEVTELQCEAVPWDEPELLDPDVLRCVSLLQPLAAWAAARSGGAAALQLSSSVFMASYTADLFSSLAALQSLKSVSIGLDVAAHSEVAELAAACCRLRGLTSLMVLARRLLPEGGGWVEAARDVPMQLCGLTGLRRLQLCGVRSGPAFVQILQRAMGALQRLDFVSLRNVQSWSDVGGASLDEVYACLPPTLTELRLERVPVGRLAERLPALVQLDSLELSNCGLSEAQRAEVAAACERLPRLKGQVVFSDDDSDV